ncbi:MAG: hypothetical protein HZC38_16900 [Chloroflexi bacterium]|nr:hypothetical protein [Chloroflexota bacterium]
MPTSELLKRHHSVKLVLPYVRQLRDWNPNANGGLGGWVAAPPSPDSAARNMTERTLTRTFVLVRVTSGE